MAAMPACGHRLVVVGRARRHVDVRIEELHERLPFSPQEVGDVVRNAPARRAPLAGVVVRHAPELRRARSSSPRMRPTGDLDEDRLQDHLVEARLGEEAGRKGVLARDRLEHGLDVRPTRLHAQRDEAARIGQEGKRPKDGLALAGVALEEALFDERLELARREPGGRVEQEGGAGQPVETPRRDGPGDTGRAEPRHFRRRRLDHRAARLAGCQRERRGEGAPVERRRGRRDRGGQPALSGRAALSADDVQEALRDLERGGRRGRGQRARPGSLGVGHDIERGRRATKYNAGGAATGHGRQSAPTTAFPRSRMLSNIDA